MILFVDANFLTAPYFGRRAISYNRIFLVIDIDLIPSSGTCDRASLIYSLRLLR